jgi:mono/diheme cytochrome c family protein
MKTLVKIVLGLVLLLVIVAACGFGYMMMAFPKVPAAPSITLDASPDRITRGKYLNDHVVGCTTCHSQRDWTKYSGPIVESTLGSGGQIFDLGPAGVLYSKNITPAAIGKWTDGELLRAVTSGVSADGSPLFPLMPFTHFGAMSEEDVHAVLAYIRTLKAIEGAPIPPKKISFPLNLIARTIPTPATFQAAPPASDKVAYGKYMVNAALCSDCHTPIDDRGQPLPGMDFAGGMDFHETGHLIRSANITPDADTGIGSWTEQQFIDKFKAFENAAQPVLAESERAQNTVMPMTAFSGMTREDLSAIYAYLRTLKPVTHRVEKFPEVK